MTQAYARYVVSRVLVRMTPAVCISAPSLPTAENPMPPASRRDDFGRPTITALAKRAGFQCSVCRAVTVGPSAESPTSVVNVGVAAHITAAAQGGKRYDKSMTAKARADIANAIWVCQTHAKLIDDDATTWTVAKLQAAKQSHEAHAARVVGLPSHRPNHGPDPTASPRGGSLVPREYAFLHVGEMIPQYRTVIGPILLDRGLSDCDELGVLMVGRDLEGEDDHAPAPWTFFVRAGWLRWFLQGRSAGFLHPGEVPPEHVYGQIPAWPDSFLDLLAAIVESNTTFAWHRHPGGYLMLCQPVK